MFRYEDGDHAISYRKGGMLGKINRSLQQTYTVTWYSVTICNNDWTELHVSEPHGHMWPNHKRQRGGFSLFALKRRQGFPTVQNSNSQKAVRRHRKSRKRPAVQVKHYLTEKSWALFLFRCSLNTGLQALGENTATLFFLGSHFSFLFPCTKTFCWSKVLLLFGSFFPFSFLDLLWVFWTSFFL